jgi:hypothetical protein
MKETSLKKWVIGLTVTVVGLLVLSGYLFLTNGWLTIRVAWAEGQTAIFEEMLDKALHGDAHIAAECLGYVAGHYPSGSKQVPGSRLDRIVERERTRVSRMIIDHLRSKTGQDLGANPNAWIEKYGTR